MAKSNRAKPEENGHEAGNQKQRTRNAKRYGTERGSRDQPSARPSCAKAAHKLQQVGAESNAFLWIALPGTDIADDPACLRVCYAMCGTDVAYDFICLRVCYAMCGTDIRVCQILKAQVLPLSSYALAIMQSAILLRPPYEISAVLLHPCYPTSMYHATRSLC
eukprot:1467297-Rhodomonas_salina.1